MAKRRGWIIAFGKGDFEADAHFLVRGRGERETEPCSTEIWRKDKCALLQVFTKRKDASVAGKEILQEEKEAYGPDCEYDWFKPIPVEIHPSDAEHLQDAKHEEA